MDGMGWVEQPEPPQYLQSLRKELNRLPRWHEALIGPMEGLIQQPRSYKSGVCRAIGPEGFRQSYWGLWGLTVHRGAKEDMANGSSRGGGIFSLGPG